MARIFAADSIGKARGSRAILKSASVWGTAGKVTALFGRNGSGKSTLLRVGAGLVRADHGVVHLDGERWVRPRLPVLAARGLFFLPDRHLLSRRMTVREQIRAVQWRFGGARADEIARRLGIAHVLDQPGRELSGGEMRRAEVAVAWIRAPRVLLADEPLAGINPSDGEVVAGALREMAGEGCAVILTGHEVRQMMDVADEIVWMAAGTTHGLGSPADAARHDQFRREYLGPGAPPRA